MSTSETPMVTSVAMPWEHEPDMEEPIIVSAEETPLALTVRDALLREPELGGADLEVRVKGDCLVLSGVVYDQSQKERALSVAGRFVGRRHVTDEIETGEQVGYVCEA